MKAKVIFRIFVFTAVGIATSACCSAPAANENPYLWQPRVKSVMVFKNELGFFQAAGRAQLRDGWCVSEPLPPAIFGTLAIFAGESDKIVDIAAVGPGETIEFEGAGTAAEPAAKQARLETLKFLKLQVWFRREALAGTTAGRLVSVGPEFAVLQTEKDTFAVQVREIEKVQVLEKPLRVHVRRLSGEAAEEAELGMFYLRKGITWIPEYTLLLLDEDTAELTLRGTLVNEAEDLIGCDVSFVVGVPHFTHTDLLTPAAVGQVVRTLGAALAPPQVMTQMMNIAPRSAATADARGDQLCVIEQPVPLAGRDLKEVAGSLPQWQGEGSSDFTVYSQKGLTVRRGEKAIVTLFVKRIKYGHLYRWSPPDVIRHHLVLRNDTDTAWTTGPCLAASEGKALSEAMLMYVPAAGAGELPVTTAINIAHSQEEAEAERALKEYSPSSNVFLDRVTVDGKLHLRNYGKKDAETIVELPVPGRPLSASHDGKLSLKTDNLVLRERAGSISWRLTLKPGETEHLSYQYERYVPSN